MNEIYKIITTSEIYLAYVDVSMEHRPTYNTLCSQLQYITAFADIYRGLLMNLMFC